MQLLNHGVRQEGTAGSLRSFFLSSSVFVNYYSPVSAFLGWVFLWTLLKKYPQRVCVHHYHFEQRIFKWSSPPLWEGENVFIWKSLLCRLEFYRPWEQEEDPGHQNNSVRIPISPENSAVRTPAANRRIAQVTGKLTGQGEGWRQRSSSWWVWGN